MIPQGSNDSRNEISQTEIEEVKKEIKRIVEIQKIVENDENLGIPEAQAALEVIHNFNQDMGKIEANM